MRSRKYRFFVGDFETTVYKGQVRTEVWASACVELFTEDVQIFHSIEDTMEYFENLNCDIICYYHNLKFDGEFWLSYLLFSGKYTQALVKEKEDSTENMYFKEPWNLKSNEFIYSISSMGQWYKIVIKHGDYLIELRDSLKLLPFSVKKIGKSFGTKHKKLDMEYTGIRYAGCTITEEEQAYIKNDVLVIKEALEIMHTEGHKKLTIGCCCLAEYKRSIGRGNYHKLFPNIYDIKIDKELYGEENAGEYIRNSYRGGWCYVVKGKEKQIKHNGITADVNSLYPSMMSSESRNKYPVGKPTFWKGNYIPEEALRYYNYYFIRIRTRFYLKKDYLPFIQIKNSLMYKATECLETSDIYYNKTGEYYKQYINFDGKIEQAFVTLTLTMTDYQLIREHYDLVEMEILDGCWFRADIGIFDNYINKYKKIKMESKGAVRELAKLFLNNLYGKMASNTSSSFKVAEPQEDGTLKYYQVEQHDKEPGYIPVGSAITSYARNFTIRTAQANYYGVNERGFIYADTDSCHMDLQPDEIKGMKIHPTNFCSWKLEASWDEGIFIRQKTYIEHVVAEDLQPIENPYYNVKCAGMPDKCKNLFIRSMLGDKATEKDTEEEAEFLKKKRDLTDFDIGLKVTGKLLPKRIRGGVVLMDTTYEMR